MLGVIIAQVMRLQHTLNPNPVLGFFVVSVPLSCVCQGSAIAISALGAIRFIRYQKEMARRYAVSGGWEIMSVGTLGALVSPSVVMKCAANQLQVLLCIFLLSLIITIDKD